MNGAFNFLVVVVGDNEDLVGDVAADDSFLVFFLGDFFLVSGEELANKLKA